MIEFKQATKKYGDKVALNNLNLTIESGEIVGFLSINYESNRRKINLFIRVI